MRQQYNSYNYGNPPSPPRLDPDCYKLEPFQTFVNLFNQLIDRIEKLENEIETLTIKPDNKE